MLYGLPSATLRRKRRKSADAQDQSEEPCRRARRRRDDPDHLAAHPRQAHPPLSRRRAAVFRPFGRASRRHQRPGDDRRGARDQGLRRRRQMRDHHAGRGAGEGIPSQGDVEEPERHDPQHPRRRDLPRADHLPQRAAAGARLDAADRRRPPRLRRPVQGDRLQGPRQGPAHHPLRGRRRKGDREGGVQVPRAPASRWRCTTSTTRSAISLARRSTTA